MRALTLLSLMVIAVLRPLPSEAYPNFIGYGYTTCITCHYNTLGNGPLNDYGRALFVQEIAARPFISKDISDETLADKSGFIPGVELPFWLHPGLKMRTLWFQTNPGTQNTTSKTIQMQREMSLALQSNAAGTVAAITSWDMLTEPQNFYGKCDNNEPCVKAIFREMYLRWWATKNLYISAGLFDKAYGLRIVDHTAVSRAMIGLGQYDQTHGLTLHWMESNWDIALQAHLGNLNFDQSVRQKGFSGTGEFEIAEKHRLGASVLSTRSELTSLTRYAIHDRWGLSKSPGTSLLWEFGVTKNKDQTTGQAPQGTYTLAELMVKLTRGYNLLSTIERSQAEITASSPENSRWSLGFLTFPFPRTEFRAQLVNGKNYSLESSNPDTWSVQIQGHLSL